MKCKYTGITLLASTINRNMRCIEISVRGYYAIGNISINRNMRCIEIGVVAPEMLKVLEINRNMRCIEISKGGLIK